MEVLLVWQMLALPHSKVSYKDRAVLNSAMFPSREVSDRSVEENSPALDSEQLSSRNHLSSLSSAHEILRLVNSALCGLEVL